MRGRRVSRERQMLDVASKVRGLVRKLDEACERIQKMSMKRGSYHADY